MQPALFCRYADLHKKPGKSITRALAQALRQSGGWLRVRRHEPLALLHPDQPQQIPAASMGHFLFDFRIMAISLVWIFSPHIYRSK